MKALVIPLLVWVLLGERAAVPESCLNYEAIPFTSKKIPQLIQKFEDSLSTNSIDSDELFATSVRAFLGSSKDGFKAAILRVHTKYLQTRHLADTFQFNPSAFGGPITRCEVSLQTNYVYLARRLIEYSDICFQGPKDAKPDKGKLPGAIQDKELAQIYQEKTEDLTNSAMVVADFRIFTDEFGQEVVITRTPVHVLTPLLLDLIVYMGHKDWGVPVVGCQATDTHVYISYEGFSELLGSRKAKEFLKGRRPSQRLMLAKAVLGLIADLHDLGFAHTALTLNSFAIGNDKRLRIFGLENAKPLNSVPTEEEMDAEDLDTVGGAITHDIDIRAFILMYVEMETGDPNALGRYPEGERLRAVPYQCVAQKPGELCLGLLFGALNLALRDAFPTFRSLADGRADPKSMVMNLLGMFTNTKSKRFSDFVAEFWEAKTIDELLMTSGAV